MAKLDKLLSEFDEDNPQHVKAINKITPEQYKDLLLGKYVDPNSRTLSIYTISRILESLTNSKDGIVKNPAKNSKLNNQIVNHLLEEMEDARNSEDEDKKDEIEGRLERMASYLPLSHATFANMLDDGINESRLLYNKNTPKSILSKISFCSHKKYKSSSNASIICEEFADRTPK